MPSKSANLYSSTLIKPIILSDSESYLNSDLISVPSEISDHIATCVFIKTLDMKSEVFKRKVWFYKANYDALNEDIINFNWYCI